MINDIYNIINNNNDIYNSKFIPNYYLFFVLFLLLPNPQH